MPKHSIRTIRDLRNAIKICDEVQVTTRFGLSETWVKLPKKEALFLIENIALETTPQEFEMGTEEFGTLEIGARSILFLG
jgi:hypothetical protein